MADVTVRKGERTQIISEEQLPGFAANGWQVINTAARTIAGAEPGTTAYRFIRQMLPPGSYTVLGFRNTGEINSRGLPIYEVNYLREDSRYGQTFQGQRFAMTPTPTGHPKARNFSVTPEDTRPGILNVPTGGEAEGPRGTETVEQLNAQWRSIERLMIDRGVKPSTAKELSDWARGAGLRFEEAMGTAGSGGVLMGDALAKMWEAGGLAQERVKKIIAAEGPQGGAIVAPVDGGAAVVDEEFDPFAELSAALANMASSMRPRSVRIYTPPDRREVEDFVRQILSERVGFAETGRLGSLVDLYMREDRRAFDQQSKGISPKAAVLEQVRNAPDYKRIHALRPDFMDEAQWVGQRVQAGLAGGLTDQAATSFGVTQAQVGATQEQAVEAAEQQRLASTGMASDALRQRFIRVGQALGKGVA